MKGCLQIEGFQFDFKCRRIKAVLKYPDSDLYVDGWSKILVLSVLNLKDVTLLLFLQLSPEEAAATHFPYLGNVI